jgi:hypothetical protein
VRVTVRDQRTGKGGLLWEEGKRTARTFKHLIPYWEQRLPAGAMAVLSWKSTMVGGGGDGFECRTNIYICPEPDQEGVAEEDMLYCVANGEENREGDDHPFKMIMHSTDTHKIGALIRSLC